MMSHQFFCGDCLPIMADLPQVDLVFTSPPYEAKRSYGIEFKHTGDDWVSWATLRFLRSYYKSRGLTAWVVEGGTKNFRWSATPAKMMAELDRMGVPLRKPPVFHRVGIPGSGGPDWLRNDYEFIVCASHGKLPWSDNTACGHEPKYGPGGAPSHRTTATRGSKAGDTRVMNSVYKPPKKANPGNVIHRKVGGGHMGSRLSATNEAPFPESLAEFFVKSFCPPGGTVLDPFCGSGTVAAVCERLGRKSISIDIRQSQIDLAQRRLEEVLNG